MPEATWKQPIEVPQCLKCQVVMRLVAIEAHPTVEIFEIFTFECAKCGLVEASAAPEHRAMIFNHG